MESSRDVAEDVLRDALDEYGEAAAGAALSLFEDTLALEGLYVNTELSGGIVTAEEISKIAHYQAGKLRVDDFDGFVEQVAGSAAHLTRQCANRTMMAQGGLYRNVMVGRNVGRNRVRYVYAEAQRGTSYEVRYARVPQGEETCDFCLMLASRGFVYLTAESAEGWNHTHRNCDCIVVAGVGHHEAGVNNSGGGDWVQDTVIEGFEMDSLRRLWGMWTRRDEGDVEGRRDDMESVLGRRYWTGQKRR